MDRTARPAVLVTGGAGYIGSHTCKALAANGYVPVALDNLSLGHRWAVKWGPLEVLDLHDTTGVAQVIKRHCVSAVVHFAASAYVGDSMRDPGFYYRNNVLTTFSLLNAMSMTGVDQLVFSSSCAVYGNPRSNPIDEKHPTAPISPYGQTKLDCENMIRWFAQAHGMRAMMLRYFNAAGADAEGELGEDHTPETRLIPRAVLAALNPEQPLQVFGTDYCTPDGTAVRDFVHVSDLATAHVLALDNLPSTGGTEVLNLGTGRGSSVKEVLTAVEIASGQKVPAIFKARRQGDPASVIADAKPAYEKLGWRPTRSELPNIVQTAWAWHQRRNQQQHQNS